MVKQKQAEHEDWLNRQAYLECFEKAESLPIFRNHRGTADKCACGCGSVSYSRSNLENWWRHAASLPSLVWGVTRSLVSLSYHSCRFILGFEPTLRERLLYVSGPAGFKFVVLTNPLGNWIGTVMTPVRVVSWFLLVLGLLVFWFLVQLLTWCMAAASLGVIVVVFAVLSGVTLFCWTMAAIYVVVSGIVFLLGGVASILYLSDPWIGIALIATGLVIEYERIRRRERIHREELGRIIRTVRDAKSDAANV